MMATLLFNHLAALTVATGVFRSAYFGPQTVTNCAPAPAGMVGWWKGEDNATDSVGLNNGTLSPSGANYAQGKVGQAFRFDGTNGYAQIPDSITLKPANVTVEAWVLLHPSLPPGQGGEQIVFKKNTSSAWFEGYSLLKETIGNGDGTSSDRFQFVVSRNGDQVIINSQTIAQRGVWYHVAATYDGNQSVLYVNGVAEASATPGFALDYDTTPLFIGTTGTWSPYLNMLDGLIDEVSIYNRALSAGEIAAIYNAGSAGKCLTPCAPPSSGLVSWWKAEGNGLDSAGTNAGVLQPGVTFATGEVGQAFSFAGAGASVNIPRAPALDVGNQVTVEFWMKADSTNAMQTYQGLVTSDFYGIEIADGRSLAQTMGLNFFISTDSGAFFPQTADANGGGFAVSAGQWHHVAGTYDGTQLQLYVDGQPTGNPYVYSGPISPMLANSFVTIGSEDGRENCPNCVNARYFDGLIDEATIYNRALSAAEIAAIYNAGSSGKCPFPQPPIILGQPTNTVVSAGNTAIFTVLASSGAPLTYQWYFGSSPLAGASAATLSLPNVQPNQAGSYSVVVSNALGSVTSSNATLTVLTFPPTILRQPGGTNVYVGSNVLFSVSVSGSPVISYQWWKDSTPFPDNNSSVYSIRNAQLTNSGSYTVVVSNPYGAVTSSPAILNVTLPPPCTPAPPGLIGWWRAETNTLDSYDNQNGLVPYPYTMKYTPGKVGAAFSVNAQAYVVVPDSPALRVTNAFCIEAWVNPSASTSPGTIAAKVENQGIQLPLRPATNSSFYLGITNSGILRLSVTPNGSLSVATTLQSPAPIPAGQWSFVVAAYDGASLQLYVNAVLVAQTNYSAGIFPGTADLGLGAIPSLNQVQPVGTLPWVGALDEISLYRRALMPDEIQAIYSADVSGKCRIPPTITLQPQSQAIPLGEDVLFAPTVLGAKPLAYQWHFNGTNLPGATNSTLLLEKVQSNRVGNYSVFITNSVGTILSSNATLTLLPPPVCTPSPPNLVSWWPADGFASDVIGTNNPSKFTDITYATGKVSRAFSFNGLNSSFVAPNSPSLNFGSNLDFSIEGWVKVLPLSPLVQPRASYDNVPLFEKRSVSVGYTGNSGYSLSLYRGRLAFWLGPTVVIPPAGSDGSMFTSPTPDLRDGMFHHVAVSLSRSVTNGGNLYVDGQLVLNFNVPVRTGLSNSASLSIGSPTFTTTNSYFSGLLDELALYNRALSANEILAIRQAGAAGKCKVPPFIVSEPAHTNIPPGHAATFTVVAGGGPTLRYQWRFGTQNLQGATASSLTISNAQPFNVGSYSVLVTNGFGSVLSSNASLTLNTPPIARCTNVTVAANSNCVASASIDNGSSDPDGDAITLQQSPPGPYPLGTNIVTLTAIDIWGASNSCVALVLVLDQTPPQLSCPTNVVAGNDLNQCGAAVSFPFPTAVDACSGVTNITCVPPPGSFFPVGVTTVHVTATDAAGNTAACSFTVTVRDTQPPAISCPANMTVEFTNETGASVSFTPQATDNCPGSVTLVSVPPSGSTFPIGSSTVRCTATDAAGNSNSCSFQVTVLGAQGVKSNVLTELTAVSATVTRSSDLAHLDEAIDHLASSLQPGLWLDQTHLARSHGEPAINEESASVQALQLLLNDKHSSLSQILVQALIDRIVKADRLLAVVAIQDALAAGADPDKLAHASEELAQGDNAVSQGQYSKGIDDYRNAWKLAEHLTIKLAIQVANGHLSLDAAGFPGEAYLIETSTNLLDWTPVGVTSADVNGSIHLDADAALGAQFYRTRLLP